jgi:hypothetical protein
VDDADWFDIMGLLDEWNENPPLEFFVRGYFGYEPPGENISADDKWFGDDRLPPKMIAERSAPPLSGAPSDVQEMFKLSMERRQKLIH